MEWLQIIILALIQGLTEFLPISSSAHLVLAPRLIGWPDQGLAFDIAVHVGTLGAVVLYFRRQLRPMAHDWFRSLTTRQLTGDAYLAWAVLFGTIPIGLAGLVLNDFVEISLRSPLIIAAATVIFGLLLWWADVRCIGERDEHSIGWRNVVLIGCAQVLALIPGTSRSGITITAGLIGGLDRTGATRFSFLLSIPVILLAGGLKTVELISRADPVDWGALAAGTAIAGISAYFSIHYFLKLIARFSMKPFALYRLLLGGLLFYLFT